MLFVKLSDGMGNQMFQYAYYKHLCHSQRNVYLDLSFFRKPNVPDYQLNVFPNINYSRLPDKMSLYYPESNIIKRGIRGALKKAHYIKYEQNASIVDEKMIDPQSGIIIGYFQNELYFNDVKNQIKHDFKFPNNNISLMNCLEKIKNYNTVSIHFRRGDYLKLKDIYGGICTEEYYFKSISYIYKHIEKPKFIVFSDDIEWVMDNFKLDDAIFMHPSMFDNYHDWFDMYIMSKCKNNIIANSSFSWWGAWLNDTPGKIVICPKRWDNLQPSRSMAANGWVSI